MSLIFYICCVIQLNTCLLYNIPSTYSGKLYNLHSETHHLRFCLYSIEPRNIDRVQVTEKMSSRRTKKQRYKFNPRLAHFNLSYTYNVFKKRNVIISSVSYLLKYTEFLLSVEMKTIRTFMEIVEWNVNARRTEWIRRLWHHIKYTPLKNISRQCRWLTF